MKVIIGPSDLSDDGDWIWKEREEEEGGETQVWREGLENWVRCRLWSVNTLRTSDFQNRDSEVWS